MIGTTAQTLLNDMAAYVAVIKDQLDKARADAFVEQEADGVIGPI
jgi:hypothetical protein